MLDGISVAIGLAMVLSESSTTTERMHELMPCTIGLSIEYTDEPKDIQDPKLAKEKTTRMIETVRGPGKELNTCVIDRLVIHADGSKEKDAWAREMLPDRITNAGWVDRPVAFRTPLLRTPIRAGRRWHFNTTDFEIKDVGDTFDVPAGTFEACVRVSERASDGAYEASSVYAPRVGLILYESRSRRVRAIKVTVPGAHESAQERAPNAKTPVRRSARKNAPEESSKTSR
jgi:hypothetical protein